tara:strand:- start:905 stop:1120 length:216 start_codon:yes stop_codon:yes gene_type:complete
MAYVIAIPISYNFYDFFIWIYSTFTNAIRGTIMLFFDFSLAIFSCETALNSSPENIKPKPGAISSISFAVV